MNAQDVLRVFAFALRDAADYEEQNDVADALGKVAQVAQDVAERLSEEKEEAACNCADCHSCDGYECPDCPQVEAHGREREAKRAAAAKAKLLADIEAAVAAFGEEAR